MYDNWFVFILNKYTKCGTRWTASEIIKVFFYFYMNIKLKLNHLTIRFLH